MRGHLHLNQLLLWLIVSIYPYRVGLELLRIKLVGIMITDDPAKEKLQGASRHGIGEGHQLPVTVQCKWMI